MGGYGFNFQVEKYLPVFVYGTLRKGFGNYRGLLEGYTEREEYATISGSLHPVGSLTGTGIPGILRSDIHKVTGEVMYIPEDIYERIMYDLDCLEGNGSMYNREEVTATLNSGEQVQVWTYFWMRPDSLGLVIEHGDWRRHVIEDYDSRNKLHQPR
jgi:gamma-glutamylcyclotransferase (GGCT)/AIG2-like uncharacterized protein YtfP